MKEERREGEGRREILQDVIIWVNLEDSTLPDINNHRKAAVAWFLQEASKTAWCLELRRICCF